MTEESRYLLEMAREVARGYSALSGARAAMVFGSVAQGISDTYSDIDMGVYYETLPPEEDLLARLEILSDDGLRWKLGHHDAGVLILAFPRNGVECQVIHATISRMESDMNAVLTAEQVKTPHQKILSGVLDGIPLYDDGIISLWKERANDYPDMLAQAMVEQHLNFFPIWAAYQWLVFRDITPWLYQTLTESIFNLLGVLAGVNRLYYADFQLKRTGLLCAKMKMAPLNLAERIESIFQSDPSTAVQVLRALVQETVEIVATAMPNVDTSAVRRALERKFEPWRQR